MTNEQILQKAFEKAVNNGFAFPKDNKEIYHFWHKCYYHRYSLIFSHSFAKAFWGEKDMWYKTECTCGGVDFHLGGFDMHKMNCAKIKAERGYKHHLQQMVICEEPLKYLEKFI